MTETLRLLVAVMVAKVLVLFGSVVPGQFKKTLAISDILVGQVASLLDRVLARVAEEVEVEACIGILDLLHQGHSEDFLVVFERLFGILDADHGVILMVSV